MSDNPTQRPRLIVSQRSLDDGEWNGSSVLPRDHEMPAAGLGPPEIVGGNHAVGHGVALGLQKATRRRYDLRPVVDYSRDVLDDDDGRLQRHRHRWNGEVEFIAPVVPP